jgi:hypothetical protein
MNVRIANPGEVDGDMFDRYTFAHFGIGVGLELLRSPWWATLGIALAWEFIENPLKVTFPEVFQPRWSPITTTDRIPNAVGDIAAVMSGWALTRYLRRRT